MRPENDVAFLEYLLDAFREEYDFWVRLSMLSYGEQLQKKIATIVDRLSLLEHRNMVRRTILLCSRSNDCILKQDIVQYLLEFVDIGQNEAELTDSAYGFYDQYLVLQKRWRKLKEEDKKRKAKMDRKNERYDRKKMRREDKNICE